MDVNPVFIFFIKVIITEVGQSLNFWAQSVDTGKSFYTDDFALLYSRIQL